MGGGKGFETKRGINVLITSVGRRAPLVEVFKQAQKSVGRFFNGKVITVNADPYCAGLYVSDGFYIVPLVHDKNYIPIILEICKEEKIDLLIPTIDDELPIFATNQERFQRLGVKIACSPLETALICNNKYKTYQFFLKNNIPTPKTYLLNGTEKDPPLPYPFIIKPRDGRGTFGFTRIRNKEEFMLYKNGIPNPIAQEELRGKEFTIDVLCDFDGRVIAVIPRERMVVRAGVSDQGRTVKDWRLISYGTMIAQLLKIRGPANIQCFVDGDSVMFTEVNPRFSGGIPLTIASGVDFPALLIRMAAGEKVEPRIGDFKENLTMLRYEMSIFREDL